MNKKATLLAVVLVVTLSAGQAMASDGIGLRVNLSPWGRFSASGHSESQAFTYGFGLQWEKTIFKIIGLGAMGMFYMPKMDVPIADRDKAWAIMSYGKVFIPVTPIVTPYVIAEIGIGQYIPSHGDNFLELPFGGGVGAEVKVGPVGIFLDIDYLYRFPLQEAGTGTGSKGDDYEEEIKSKVKWHGLGINFGVMVNI